MQFCGSWLEINFRYIRFEKSIKHPSGDVKKDTFCECGDQETGWKYKFGVSDIYITEREGDMIFKAMTLKEMWSEYR